MVARKHPTWQEELNEKKIGINILFSCNHFYSRADGFRKISVRIWLKSQGTKNLPESGLSAQQVDNVSCSFVSR